MSHGAFRPQPTTESNSKATTNNSSNYTKLCRRAGGDLEQIKFLLWHSSIQTTERYLGSEQEIVVAVNDNLGL
jgi:hypothetical protein